MTYDKTEIDDIVSRFGEVFFVLDSDREYKVHGEESFEHIWISNKRGLRIEGMHDGEYLIVEFPLDAIEHYYTHREV